MEHNPYTPTAATLQSTAADATGYQEFELASRERRLINSLVDTLGCYLLAIVVTMAVALVYRPMLQALQSPVASYAFGSAVCVIYFFASEALLGRTLGKYLTRTKVVSASGEPLGRWQLLRRSLVRLVPFEALTFLSRQPVGLHDRWSETRVIML